MENNIKVGQNNGQNNNGMKVPQGTTGKSIWANESFRKGVLTGAGTTIGGAAIYFIGKVVVGKIKTAIAARKAAKEAASAAAPTK